MTNCKIERSELKLFKKDIKFPRKNSYPKDYDYLRFYISKNPIVRYAFLKRLEKAIDISSNNFAKIDTILEIGPGPGFLFLTFSEYANDVIGLDLEDHQLKAVREMALNEDISHKVILIQGDIVELPFKSNSLSLVYCFSVLEHVANLERAVTELYRVLKQKGSLIVGIPIDTFITRVGRIVMRVGEHPNLENLYSNIRRELEKCFDISRIIRIPHDLLPESFSLYEILKLNPGRMKMNVVRVPPKKTLPTGLTEERMKSEHPNGNT